MPPKKDKAAEQQAKKARTTRGNDDSEAKAGGASLVSKLFDEAPSDAEVPTDDDTKLAALLPRSRSDDGRSSGSDGQSRSAAPLDTFVIKRFKSHAGYHAGKAGESAEWASKALQIYAEGDTATKAKVLASFSTDKSYKFVTTYEESTKERTVDKSKFAGGWMSKFDYAALLNIPSSDKATYDALMDAAVEGLEWKPHPNSGLARAGVNLFLIPDFKVGGDVTDVMTESEKILRSETPVVGSSMASKAGLADDKGRVKLEYPSWIKMMAKLKTVEQGQKILGKTLNSSRTVLARIRSVGKGNENLRQKIDNFGDVFDEVASLELDVLNLVAMAKSLAKDDVAAIENMCGKIDTTLKNGDAAVKGLDQLRKEALTVLA
jgi:hypothetical protein